MFPFFFVALSLLAAFPLCGQGVDSLLARYCRQADRMLAEMDREGVKAIALELRDLSVETRQQYIGYWADFYYAEGLMRSNPKEAYPYAESALAGFSRLKDAEMTARSQMLVGNVLSNQGEYEASLGCLYDAFNYRLEQDTAAPTGRRNLLKTLSNIGFVYLYTGKFKNAAEYFFEAERHATILQDTLLATNIVNHIGNSFFMAEDYPTALRYYRKSYALAKRINHSTSIRIPLTGLGNAHYKMHQLDSALWYNHLGYELAKQANDQVSVASSLNNLAAISGEMKKLPEALAWLDELRVLSEKLNLDKYLADGYINLAGCAGDMGAYKKAIDLNQKGLALAQKMGNQPLMSDFHFALYKVYQAKGDYPAALQSYLEYDRLSDTLLNEEVVGRIKTLETQYETAKKEARILALNEENRIQALEFRRQTTTLIAVGLSVLLFFLVAILYSRQRTLRSQKKALELEQRLLSSQMNPHFTFNALASIQAFLLHQGQADRGAFYLTRFAKLIRQVLEHSRSPLIPLSDEIESLHNYLSIQQLRFENQFVYRIEMDETIDADLTMIPPMLIQPFVENAIEHGKIYTVPGGLVQIRFKNLGDYCRIEVTDNGIGRATARQLNHRSEGALATQITRERCALLSKTYRKTFSYEIRDEPGGGTRVVLTLPSLAETPKVVYSIQTA